MSEHPVIRFRRKLESLERYPEGVVPVPRYIPGTAFFSAGSGLEISDDGATELPEFPFGGVMLVGHNLDSLPAYERRLESGRPHGSLKYPMTTWRNLRRLLRAAEVSTTACFFTNAYVGLNEKATTGVFPGSLDSAFSVWCRDFLIEQIEVMRPALLLALGAPASKFLATLSQDLEKWGEKGLPDCQPENVDIASVPLVALAVMHPSAHHTPQGIERKVKDAQALRQAAEAVGIEPDTRVHEYLGKMVRVSVERPMGTTHPGYPESEPYPVNYGEVAGTIGGDGDPLDAYVLGIKEPIEQTEGIVIAIIHRNDDVEDKLVVVPAGVSLTDSEIRQAVAFQEKYFDSEIIRS